MIFPRALSLNSMGPCLILGGNGQLGKAVIDQMPVTQIMVVKTHHDLDLMDEENLRHVLEEETPSVIINCAAYTAVDQAENEPEKTYAINSKAVGNLARLVNADVRIIHISTDFVFSERISRPYKPNDSTNPVSVYGKSKLAGEANLLTHHPRNSVIVRTSWLYSAVGRNFVLTMLRLMAEREELGVVADQYGSPTSTRSLAEIICKFMPPEVKAGLYHWCDSGVISWYDFAVEIHKQALEKSLLKKPVLINPISTMDYPTLARRPAYSALDCSDTEKILSTKAVPWRESLSRVLDEIKKNRFE